jgi:hypothetical protein
MLRRTVVAAAALALAAPAAARADTIVFQRAGDLYAVQPDGTNVRRLTQGGGYAWPSAADDGTVAALGPNGGIYRFTPQGDQIGDPTPTALTFASDDNPAEPPTHVRVSPDGQKVAYDEVIDDGVTTLWTPAGSTALDFPGQLYGQEGLASPSWIDNARLLLSRDITDADPDTATFTVYDTADGDDSSTDLFSDTGSADWATGYDAAAARGGARFAVVEDDAADNGGDPTRVALRLFAGTTFACELPLPVDDSYIGAGPTFSADGSRLAWAQQDGIHVASLGDLSDCSAIKQQTIGAPGDTQPYWTPAATIAGTPPPSGGTTSPPGKLKLTVKVRSSRKLLLGRGILLRVTCSAACAPRVSLRLGVKTAHRAGTRRIAATAGKRLTAAGTVRMRVKLRRSVARGLRRLSAFRIHLRVSATGAPSVVRTLKG